MPEIKLEIKIPVRVWLKEAPESPSMEEIGQNMAKGIEQAFIAWEDGRYNFDRELISHGLNLMLEYEYQKAIEKHFRGLYGNEMVKTGDNGSEAKDIVEARKMIQKKGKPYIRIPEEYDTPNGKVEVKWNGTQL